MRKIGLILCIVFGGLSSKASEKPNVVFILSDDQSWGDYGFMGHPNLKTPNLDQFGGEGLVYERGYTTAAICRPSLASIVTGLYPHQTGVRGNRPFMGEGVDHRQLRRNKKLWPLAQEQSKVMTATLTHAPSMVRQLRDSGYATLQTGKWWEGDPHDHGFDEGCGHQIGRKTMEPIYNFVDKAQKNRQLFLFGNPRTVISPYSWDDTYWKAQNYESRDPQNVIVTEGDLQRNYREVATIFTEGGPKDLKEAYRLLRTRLAECGADAVIKVREKKMRISKGSWFFSNRVTSWFSS